MNYILESIGVGLYTHIIYIFFTLFFRIKSFYVMLLCVGFCKHYLGSILNFHTWYCKNGNACKPYGFKKENTATLFMNSCYESLLFLITGSMLSYIVPKSYLFFVIGISLHIIFEQLNIHTYYCKHNCL
jgi:hypothetical protein